MSLKDQICSSLNLIRERRPLVHSITNLVVMNETANAILCLGALPIMSHAVEEVEEMVALADALVLNIGTLTPSWIDAMELAGKRASALKKPVILDPVGAGTTKLRTEACKRLLSSVNITIVRGNAGELAALIGVSSEVRGVESIGTSETSEHIATCFAKEFSCVAAVTGAIDVVSSGASTARISNGDAMLGRVVGTGCISSVIVGSFAAVDRDPFTAAIGGLVTLGIAGELAATCTEDKGPGAFHVELYNALAAVSPDHIRSRAKVEML